MHWNYTRTDLDARDDQLISEQLRHERLAHQNSIIDEIELAPAGQPLPVLTVARYRQQKLDEEVARHKSVLDLMGNEPDELKM